ncbi:GntR family transcriptional regulator [Nakamurella endophytica]|uniref:GntR family transcriptional regulator n=1 Tax=Nakamurella endophytica TaxID=1748367 RepID=A0A917SMV2_9ACTN|nr:GntR family transcriptional regulator [Nakamurella endophytica]GGL87583.1 GntR family transcriptional regulator [Nakamurella endophytica]
MAQDFGDLDRSSPMPLYFQVSQLLERAITSGRLGPGARLDNEISLADQFGLSRPTMRRAIQELVDKGLLVRKRGVGTQVVHGKVTRPVELTSLFDDLSRAHQAPATTVLVHEVVPARDDVAARLDVRPGTRVLHLRRVRWANGEPLAVLENYLPQALADIDADELAARGLYQVMRARGVHFRVARQRIGARAGTVEECRLLGERRGAPLLTMERATHDDSGATVEWGGHVYRASQYSFEVTLVDH